MSQIQKHFNQLQKLIEMEYKYEQQTFKNQINQLNLQERINLGITIYPFILTDTNFDLSGNIVVFLEATKQFNISSEFKNGAPVEIFADNLTITGIIKGQPNNQITIVLNTDTLPDWLDEGKLGINLRADETTYKRILNALKVAAAPPKEIQNLIKTLVNEKSPSFENTPLKSNTNLNPIQNKAVEHCLNANQIGIIHGPPGTGKTTTLVEYIFNECQRENTVLACASSNTAVDWLTEKLANKGINVVRLGNPVRITDTVIQHSLEYKLNNHPEAKMLDDWRKEAKQLRQNALKFKRNFGAEQRAERKQLLAEVREWQRQIRQQQKLLIDSILSSAQVVCATLTGSDNNTIDHQLFDVCVIDECAQALEPACYIPIIKSKKVVLAGDPFQLPPTIKCHEAATKGLSISLMERLINLNYPNTMLETQYRMNGNIMEFSSQQFYNNQLKAHASVATHKSDNYPTLLFIDTAGSGFNEEETPETESKANQKEAQLLINYIINNPIAINETVGIIAPYRGQVKQIDTLFNQHELPIKYPNISINTVDSFQGQEKDIIIISLTRSNDRGEIGFLKDYRRMNVAMTRAKKSLVIIGDSATLSNDNFYNQMLQFFEQKQAYHSVWEFSFAFN